MKDASAQTSVRLVDLLREETIRVGLKASDWREAVRLAGQLLLDTGAVTPAYIDAMVRVVEGIGPYMVVAPGITLAHARPEDGVNQMGMSLVRLATPVEFGSAANDPVDLILAFGAVDKKAHLQALRELALFLQNEEAVAAIRRCDTRQDAVELIKFYT